MYESGDGCHTIARSAGVRHVTVRQDLIRAGVTLRPRHRVLALSAAEYRRLYCDEKLGVRALATRFGLSDMKVWRDLTALGIEKRSSIVQTGLRRDWFDSIDSDAKAYAFGLICADGSIQKHRIRIQLQERDGDVLRRIRDAAGGGYVTIVRKAGPIATGRGHTSQCRATVGLRWQAKQLAEALGRRGVCPNKSRVLPKITAPARFLGAFVRGLIDGDGCLHIAKGGAPTVGFANLNESLLEHVARYCKTVTGKRPTIQRRVRSDGRTDKCLVVYGAQAVCVAQALYLDDESTIAIDRKRDLARRMVRETAVRLVA